MKTYDVTYTLTRRVTITVSVPNGEEPTDYSDDELVLNDDEEIVEYEVSESVDDYDYEPDFGC
jgi:hypothetical protein